MRVLFVNHFPLTGSGSGVYTANLAKSLEKQGDDVAIIFPENRSEYEKYENIKLYPVFFKWKEEIPGVNQSQMNFPCFTTHPRSTFNFIDMNDEQRKEYETLFYNTIEKAIKEFKPDIIHAQHVWTLAGLSAKACEKYKLPMVTTCHGTDLMGILKEEQEGINWGRNWAKYASDYSDSIITISEDSHSLAKRILGDNINAICIKNGVDTQIFTVDENINKKEVLEKLGIDKEYKNIVSFVGKLTDFKGVDVLVDAVSKYEDEDTLTLIAGDGELREKLENQAKELNISNLVFLGNKPQTIINEIYNIANVSCVPSRREPFGLVAAEAMASGTPVIATNEGGLPDFINENVGILVPVEDSDAISNAVKSILRGEKKFDRNIISKEAQENHSVSKKVVEFKKTYNTAIRNQSLKSKDDQIR